MCYHYTTVASPYLFSSLSDNFPLIADHLDELADGDVSFVTTTKTVIQCAVRMVLAAADVHTLGHCLTEGF